MVFSEIADLDISILSLTYRTITVKTLIPKIGVYCRDFLSHLHNRPAPL